MIAITNLSDQSDMLTYVPLSDGSTVQFEFIYRPAIQRWAVNVIHPLLTLAGFMLCASPNCLRSWKNIIPFGLLCLTTDGADPFDIEDFKNARATVYCLDESIGDVTFIEKEFFSGQAAA